MGLTLKGVNIGGFGGYELSDQLKYNLKFWLDWGFANAGAFGICDRSVVGYEGSTNQCRLYCVDDDRYELGRIWNGIGQEWVWESGVAGNPAPFRVSGVYVDGGFHPIDENGLYAHHVDYQRGRIVFDTPQNPASVVETEYAYRQVHVAFADSPLLRVLMEQSLENHVAGPDASGTPARENQIALPAVFIDIASGSGRGLQLGGGQIKKRMILFHIFADNPRDRDILMDWLDYQNRTAFVMADLNSIAFPFDEYGSVASGVTNWVDMATEHPWKKLRVQDGVVRRLDSINAALFRGRVEWNAEIDIGGI